MDASKVGSARTASPAHSRLRCPGQQPRCRARRPLLPLHSSLRPESARLDLLSGCVRTRVSARRQWRERGPARARSWLAAPRSGTRCRAPAGGFRHRAGAKVTVTRVSYVCRSSGKLVERGVDESMGRLDLFEHPVFEVHLLVGGPEQECCELPPTRRSVSASTIQPSSGADPPAPRLSVDPALERHLGRGVDLRVRAGGPGPPIVGPPERR